MLDFNFFFHFDLFYLFLFDIEILLWQQVIHKGIVIGGEYFGSDKRESNLKRFELAAPLVVFLGSNLGNVLDEGLILVILEAALLESYNCMSLGFCDLN